MDDVTHDLELSSGESGSGGSALGEDEVLGEWVTCKEVPHDIGL